MPTQNYILINSFVRIKVFFLNCASQIFAMNRIQREPTKKSPQVDLNPETKSAHFSGRSISSDGFLFYEEIIDWFKINSNSFDKFNVHFGFDHINTVTNKCLLQILLMMKKLKDEGRDIYVEWAYDEDDDDMLETGQELELLSEMQFNYSKK